MLSAFRIITGEARVLGTASQAPLWGALRLSPGGRLSHLGPGDEVSGLWEELWPAQNQSELLVRIEAGLPQTSWIRVSGAGPGHCGFKLFW